MQDQTAHHAFDVDELQDDLYLTFSIGDEVFGIGIEYVKEIIGIQPITSVPDFPESIRGVINLRGRIVPVMDVRLRFHKPNLEYDARTCIIVVDIANALIGLIVDRVAEVVAIPEIAAPPEIGGRETGYIKGFGKIGGEIKLLLDCEILLQNDVQAIKQKRRMTYEVVCKHEDLEKAITGFRAGAGDRGRHWGGRYCQSDVHICKRRRYVCAHDGTPGAINAADDLLPDDPRGHAGEHSGQ